MLTNRKWILLPVLAALGAAFLLLNFRAAASNTQAESNVITTSIGEGMPYPMQRKDKITVFITGEGPLVRALQKSMRMELRNAGLGEVELLETPGKVYQNPVLMVHAGNPGVLWTPLFGTSQLKVKAAYASNGDSAFINVQPVTVDNKNGPALNMSAEYKISDSSYGVLSRPGYYQLLADWLAKNIVQSTGKLYEPKLQ